MSKDTPMEDEKTVLAAKHRPGADTLAKQPAMIDGPVLTDQSPPPTIEKLEDRMIFSARLQAAGTFNVSLNPLVAAASGLLSCVVGLKHSEVAPGIPELREQLINDLNAFVQEALYNGVDYDLAMKARYVMSTVLDETVVTTPWGYESEWSQHTLLSSLHNETFGGEKVFHVLEQLCRNPVVNLSLLELIYLCLSLGFRANTEWSITAPPSSTPFVMPCTDKFVTCAAMCLESFRPIGKGSLIDVTGLSAVCPAGCWALSRWDACW